MPNVTQLREIPQPSFNELVNWRNLGVGSVLLYRGLSAPRSATGHRHALIYHVTGVQGGRNWRWRYVEDARVQSLSDRLRIRSTSDNRIIGVPTIVYSVLWMLQES